MSMRTISLAKVDVHPANADYEAHLAYYDTELALSFTLSQQSWPAIQISFGGYAEPVQLGLILDEPGLTLETMTIGRFQEICRQWVEEYRP